MSNLLYPPFLQWEITSRCNHNCIHCYNYWRAHDIAVEECVRPNDISDAIIARKPLYIAITGGEPLLVFSKVKEAIIKFSKAGIKTSISTNGTLITDDIIEFLEKYDVDLVISYPSCDNNICDAVCSSHNVVHKLEKIWPLLKHHNINTTINIVINKLNLPTLYSTIEHIKPYGFCVRVGIAQRPINASDEYLAYALNKDDIESAITTCICAKKMLGVDVDFSVCLPDCAFANQDQLYALEKGSCFAGSIAYAICTNGDVKACQCDTRVYGNILVDPFETIYASMSEWRDGSLVPVECKTCARLPFCQGGCRIEAYANAGRYQALPTFAQPELIHSQDQCIEEQVYSLDTVFNVDASVIFLKDAECWRVSRGIKPAFLSDAFAQWLKLHKRFSLSELASATTISSQQLSRIVEMLIQNDIIRIEGQNTNTTSLSAT